MAGIDDIDLSAIDANTKVAHDQAFAFIDTSACSKVAGQRRYAASDGHATVSGDVNGDGKADFAITLKGAHALGAGDFVL